MTIIGKEYVEELIENIKKGRLSKDQIANLKIKLCKKHRIKKIPTDIQVLMNADKKDAKILKKYLLTKPVRSISGVAVIAVMTKPARCPHGKCTMCPGGPSSVFGDVPQSYTGKEPATMRALRANFDPYLQVFNRLEQYIVTGHVPDKAELIIMGGTFPALQKNYQRYFVKNCFKAMNDFSRLFFKNNELDIVKFKKFFELPGEVGDPKRTENIHKKLLKLEAESNSKKTKTKKIMQQTKTDLEKEQEKNEKSTIRCVGLTIETRPDWGFKQHGNFMLKLGCTRVELGVQSVYDKALKNVRRGHTTKDAIKSIRELKDLGFKLNFHMMIGLPGITQKQDLQGLNELFGNEDYQPDMLKIYPCMVLKGTELYRQWKAGRYKPVTTHQAAQIIAEFKQHIPEFCRVMRIQRDIPSYRTEAGVDRTNLRQYVMEIMKKKKIKCRCIRCREIGRAEKRKTRTAVKAKIKISPYNASKGNEFFIAAETKDNILGFCRLRFPSQNLRKEITQDSALIRELHVYGTAVAIGRTKKGAVQHIGIGRKLLAVAEDIAKTYYKNKIIVISAVGVRRYFRNLGYHREGPYMVKGI